MFVYCVVCCACSGLCAWLITLSGSYRVCVCDLETSTMGDLGSTSAVESQKKRGEGEEPGRIV